MSSKKITGIVLIVISVALIIWAITRITSFAGQLHSWSPPFSDYEVVTLVVGVIALILLIVGILLILWKNKNVSTNTSDSANLEQPKESSINFKSSAHQITEVSKEAAKDAVEVSKSFFSDPIGGLSNTFTKLGDIKSRSVGILFIVFTIIIFVIGFSQTISNYNYYSNTFIKSILIIIVLEAIVFFSLMLSRAALNGQGSINSDFYITGLSLAPFGLLIFISSILGIQSIWSFFAYLCFGITYTVLILFSGLTKIYKFSDSKSSIIIAIILFLLMNIINFFM